MKKNIHMYILGASLFIQSCTSEPNGSRIPQGKAERETLSVVSKVPGRIQQLFVHEGDLVKKGDTLAILDAPEIQAKMSQAQGAVKSASAQYDMSVRGASKEQLTQLQAKKAALTEQYSFARKSLDRLETLVQDSLIPQQQYDEVYAKYQGAKAQLTAVNAEIAGVEHGVRLEQQLMALGQQDRALGALEEAQIADKERYILAPQDMKIESITLAHGELALPGYTLFTGSLDNSLYFRFTLPESQLKSYGVGNKVTVEIPYLDKNVPGIVQHVKQIGAYANIATAYPDYNMQDPLYEIIVHPRDSSALDIFSKATVLLKP